MIYSGFPECENWKAEVMGDAPSVPENIIGVGMSPFVRYEGSGLYFIESCENESLRVTLLPDTTFIRPHWKELHTGEAVVELDYATSHLFEIILPGNEGPRWIYRKSGSKWHLVAETSERIIFDALPGEYLIEKSPTEIDRRLLEEGWGK